MKQPKWKKDFDNDFWKAEGKTFFPNEWAKNKVKHFIKTQRKELLDSIEEEIDLMYADNEQNYISEEYDSGFKKFYVRILKLIKSKR